VQKVIKKIGWRKKRKTHMSVKGGSGKEEKEEHLNRFWFDCGSEVSGNALLWMKQWSYVWERRVENDAKQRHTVRSVRGSRKILRILCLSEKLKRGAPHDPIVTLHLCRTRGVIEFCASEVHHTPAASPPLTSVTVSVYSILSVLFWKN